MLVSELSSTKYAGRRDLPSAVPLVWDPCHQIELIFKRLCVSVDFLKAQLERLSDLRSISAIGIGKYKLQDECAMEGADFFVTKKDASTRWIAHQESCFKNHLKTLPQQIRCLLKAKKKKKASTFTQIYYYYQIGIAMYLEEH